MSKEYDNYLKEHRDNVMKAWEWLHEHVREEFLEIDWESCYYCCKEHDASKNCMLEYKAYDQYFYPRTEWDKDEELFEQAWLHHIHNNPHHWNHWVLVNDSGKIKGLRMPDIYIIEMLCDWMSFSFKCRDLSEIIKFYEKNKSRMILHEETRKTIERVLKRIKEELKNG